MCVYTYISISNYSSVYLSINLNNLLGSCGTRGSLYRLVLPPPSVFNKIMKI